MSKADYESIKLSNQLCFALYSANNAVIRAYRGYLDQLDLTYSQFIVMMALWETDNINLKKLTELTHLDSGTLTPIVKRLENKKFLSRERSTADERVCFIKLTELGWSLRDQAAEIPELVKCKIELPREALKTTRSHCETIADSLIKNE